MIKNKYEQSVVTIGDWKVSLVSDEDGHLSVYLSHKDGTEIIDCNSDIANEHEWADRFTTVKIEKDFKKNRTSQM